jgi:hypothetical protein
MTREDAVKMIRALFRVFGSDTAGLNEENLGGIMLPEADLFFEYDARASCLFCRASIHTPREPFTVNELEAFTSEKGAGAPSGGGRLEYMAENNGIFLARSYDTPVADGAFVSDMRDLANAALIWRREVLPRALTSVHARPRATP